MMSFSEYLKEPTIVILEENEIEPIKAIRSSVKIDRIHKENIGGSTYTYFITKHDLFFRNEIETDKAFAIALRFQNFFDIRKVSAVSI